MITVNITDKEPVIVSGLIQWDYGQKLQIAGLNLPETVEIHFSLTENCGNRVPSIGYTVDGITEVDVPDFILQNESEDACHFSNSYYAYAFVYVADGETGTTERKITLDIERSPKPSTNVPEDQKDKFLQEVRQVLAETKEVAQSVRTDADNGKFNGAKGDKGKSAYQYAVEGGFKGTVQEFIDLMAQAGHVDLTGYVSKEEHEAELLKAFVKVTTDKAPYHHITDSANMKVVDFGMEGITEQDTTSGKNLYSGGDVSGTQYVGWKMTKTIPAGTYTISANVTSSDTDATNCLLLLYNSSTSVGSCQIGRGLRASAKVTLNGDINRIDFYASNSMDGGAGDTFSFTDIQIEPGEVATEYEPYTNGPSPNLEYEQEIKLAGVLNEETGRYEHKCCVGNKNWFDLKVENVTKMHFGYTIENIDNGIKFTYSAARDAYVKLNESLRPNTTYTISFEFEVDKDIHTNDCLALNVVKASNSSKWFQITAGIRGVWANSGNGKKSVTFTTPDTDEDILVFLIGTSMANEVTGTTKFTNFMITMESSASDDYTPHASQPFTLTSDRPLTKWDNLVKVDGKWYWDYKQLKLIVDGTLKWSASATGFMAIALPESMRFREAFCNQLRVITIEKEVELGKSDVCYLGRTSAILFCDNSRFYDESLEDKGLANWKAHLNEHPLEIVTYKDESELVPLLDEEQELLRNLEMYYGVTNIYNEQGCPISITYCADQELHWNQKLLQIQQAII